MIYAAALALGLSLVIGTAFHASHMLCEGGAIGSHSRGAALLQGLRELFSHPLHMIVAIGPLWLGWTGLLLAAANRAIPPVVGLGVVVISILGTVFFYAFAAPNVDCAHFSDSAMGWRIGGLFAFVAILLLIPRLWRRA